MAGAIVIVNWNIQGPWNGAPQGQLELVEVVTAADGRFRIPAWGPRGSSKGTIRIDEPTIRIFKPGFIPLVLKNYEGVPMQSADPIIVSRFQNTTIKLSPFLGPMAENEATLAPLLRSLEPIYHSRSDGACYWKQTPRLLLALETLKAQLADHGGGHSLRFAHQYGRTSENQQCGSPEQFFADYRNTQQH